MVDIQLLKSVNALNSYFQWLSNYQTKYMRV